MFHQADDDDYDVDDDDDDMDVLSYDSCIVLSASDVTYQVILLHCFSLEYSITTHTHFLNIFCHVVKLCKLSNVILYEYCG